MPWRRRWLDEIPQQQIDPHRIPNMRRMTRPLQQDQLAAGVLREGDAAARGLDGVSFTVDD